MTTDTTDRTTGQGSAGEADGALRVATTGSRVLGIASLVGLAILLYCAFVWTPPEATQGDAVRLLYLHVPVVTAAYAGCLVTFVGSIFVLWKRSVWWDLVAASSAEVAALFTALTLATGMIWGRSTWGVYWVWDARLTSTAMLFLLLLGYLAMRASSVDPDLRARRSAWLGVLLLPNMVLVHQSVEWWRSLHQAPTLFRDNLNPTIDGSMLTTLVFGMFVFGVLFAWLVLHRFRVAWLRDQAAEVGLRQALAERRAEARAVGVVS